MKDLSKFYSKVSKENIDLSVIIQKIMEEPDADNSLIMNHYFRRYWIEFKSFWRQSGEELDWITFALAPHNAVLFIQWVFVTHPMTVIRIQEDLERVGRIHGE